MVKSEREIAAMRVAGRATAQVLEALNDLVLPGVTTMEINDFCEDYIIHALNSEPGSKGQYGFPYVLNTSINHVVCHGWPSENKVLKSGDIVNVDVTVKKEGYYGDSSKMFCIGKVPAHAQRLVDVTQECLYRAIELVRPGATLGDIGAAIQTHAERNNYSVVREYGGHGIGRELHEEPHVLHFGSSGQGLVLEEGMTFTIEPMVNQGKRFVKELADGWTVVTNDRRLSAQWEHTLLVTKVGCDILTLRAEELS